MELILLLSIQAAMLLLAVASYKRKPGNVWTKRLPSHFWEHLRTW